MNVSNLELSLDDSIIISNSNDTPRRTKSPEQAATLSPIEGGIPANTTRHQTIKRKSKIIVEENFTVSFDSRLITESQTSINMEKILAAQSADPIKLVDEMNKLQQPREPEQHDVDESSPGTITKPRAKT
jgi:hypothetical protein